MRNSLELFVLFASLWCWVYFACEVSGQSCDPSQRVDCGYSGITQPQCESKGCCWNPVDPNPGNLPWCFYKSYGPPGTYWPTIYQSDPTGFAAILTLRGNPQISYGTLLPFLRLEVTYESEVRIHVKISDANNTRWEIPTNIVPAPGIDPSRQPNNEYTVPQPSADTPFSLSVIRNMDAAVIFNISAVLFADQYLEANIGLTASSSTNVYGIGERVLGLKLPTDSHSFTMWNEDIATPVDENEYGAHPFYLQLLPNGNAHGVFFRNSNGMDVILNNNQISFKAIGGVMDFYIFVGPTPHQVIQQYHAVIGYPHMPPIWSLGWHQCKFGYKSISEETTVVARYAAAGIPLDVMWSDINYMDGYKDFTWDPNNFPVAQVTAFSKQLTANGQYYVTIVDPGIHNQNGYGPYDRGVQQNVFLKSSDGVTDFVGSVWPGSTVFPDFFNPKAHSWWQNEIDDFISPVGIAGLWIDMNEISNFQNGQFDDTQQIALGLRNVNNPPYSINNLNSHSPLNTKTTAMDAIHFGIVLEYDAHNLFGLTESIATHQALVNITNQRAFVLSRSTFPSSGAYAAHWLGDNHAQWSDMYYSLPGIMTMNMYGVPFVGADACGFIGTTTEELCARWTGLAAFTPFARNHHTDDGTYQEPYLWPSVTAVAQKTISARYSLMPYLYALFYMVNQQGGMVVRPLFFDFASDVNTAAIDKQFLFGPSVLVSPVLDQGATSVSAYFPPTARWYSLWTGVEQKTTGYQTLPVSLTDIQVHIKGGSVLLRQQPNMTLTATRKQPFYITAALDSQGEASGLALVDDGLALQVGAVNSIIVSYTVSAGTLKTDGHSAGLQPGWVNSLPHLSSIEVYGIAQSTVSSVSVNGIVITSWTFDSQKAILTVSALQLPIDQDFSCQWA